MDNHAIVLGGCDWTQELSVLPGAHVAVLSETADLDGFLGRRAGLELRDTLLVLSAGVTSRCILLFRNPLREKTVVEQVLKTGTGSINIDACRVPSDGSHFRSTVTGRTGGAVIGADERAGPALGMFQPGTGFEPSNHTGGRWPPNVLLVHGASCQQVGVRRVRSGPSTYLAGTRTGGFSGEHPESQVGTPVGTPSVHYADADGLETIPDWQCQEDCPVRLLDEQTGDRPGMPLQTNRKGISPKGYGMGVMPDPSSPGYGDSGGASRFFPQFTDDYELVAWVRRLIVP